MTDWLERARREIQNSLSQTAAKTAKTGVSAATAAPHLEESGISGVGFVGFGSTLAEGFPENDGDFHPHREIQETSSQTAAKTAKTPLPPERRPVDTRHLLPSAALAEIPPDDPAQRRIKVSILGKNGLMVTIVTQSAWTLHEWKQFAWRHYDEFTNVHGCPFDEDGEGGPRPTEPTAEGGMAPPAADGEVF